MEINGREMDNQSTTCTGSGGVGGDHTVQCGS